MIHIFIITFNRAKNLQHTLQEIKNSKLSSLKITILDNCSNDETEKVIREFTQSGSLNLSYIKHSVNVGAVANLMRAYELVLEEYVWIICDDDDYNFKNFASVPEILNKFSPDILLVGGLSNKSADAIFPNRTNRLLKLNHFYDTDLIKILTFLPSAIIKNQKLKQCNFDLGYILSETRFPQLFWIAESLKSDWSIYIQSNFMIYRSQTNHGLGSNLAHANSYLKAIQVIDGKEHLEAARKSFFGKSYLYFLLKIITRDKISNQFKIKTYISHMALLDIRRVLIAIFLVPITLLPLFLFNFISYAHYKNNK